MPCLSTDTLLGTQIAQLTGNDVDSGPALSYTLMLDGDAVGTFSVLRYGGRIALTGPLDYEQRSHYTVTLRASDTRHETEANLTVIVEDVNDNAPTFSQGFYQVLCTQVCQAVWTILYETLCCSCMAHLALQGTEIPLRMGLSPSWPLSSWAPIHILTPVVLSLWHGQEAETRHIALGSAAAGLHSCMQTVHAGIGGNSGKARSGGRWVTTWTSVSGETCAEAP